MCRLRRHGEILMVAMAPPAALDSQDAVRAFTRKKLEIHLASDEAIERAIARLYRGVETRRAVIELGVLRDVSFSLPKSDRPPELVEQLRLSQRAREVVDSLALKHSVAHREVVGRLVEMWVAGH